jgi:tetraacyldisaccharide 4'-kinase
MKFFKPKFWDKNQISLFSILLFPFAFITRLINFLKSLLTVAHQPSIPIICVGNIYIGGTGKTPLCLKIFSILKNLNMNPAFIRKKYTSFEDEVELQKKLGPVHQSKKRINAIETAIQNNANVAILDDGFQDFSINKSLSIVCFNQKQWIGNGLIVPAGPLRESLSALKRANCVLINGKKFTSIENQILSQNKKIKIFYSKYKAENIDKFKYKKVIAFAGIGNPSNFFDLLRDNNLDIIEVVKFPDHYRYTKKELENLINISKKNNAILLTTEKDYERIFINYRKNIEYIKISLEIEKEDQLINEIKKII